jgi:uncharacterized membrane protein
LEDDGLRVLDRLDTGTETGEINVEDVAMVYRTDKGKVKIQQSADATAAKGAVKAGGGGRRHRGAGGQGPGERDL